MNILYLSRAQLPSRKANSIQVVKMCAAFASLGHTVTLVVPKALSTSKQQVFDYYGVKHSFDIEVLECSPGGWRHVYGLRLLMLARSLKPDCVFSRFLAGAAWTSFAGIPTVHEVHEPIRGRSSWIYVNLLKNGRGFRGFVSITQALKSAMLQEERFIGMDEVIHVEPDGMDLPEYINAQERGRLREMFNVGNDDFLAMYTGQLYPGKGVDLLLEVAAQCPNICFVIIGGEEKAVIDYRRKAGENGLGNVLFTGFIPPSEISSYLQASDALLLPTQRRVEGSSGGDIGKWSSPLKMFEYMAAGVPVVASDLPVFREILDDSNSILCNPDNVVEWVAVLNDLRDNYDSYTELSTKARGQVTTYSWAKRAQRCVGIFTEGLSEENEDGFSA